ncbi:MAG: PorV/PorQ family protein [Ferruginibacter sp.]|nr:PorV/PorQ family protein [Cytophagales bacterium]
MTKPFVFLLCFGFAGFSGRAQVRAPKYANEFLSVGVGARALGMANTGVALTNDVTAAYWNPAGLGGLPNRYEVALMHNELFAGGAQYDYAGFATRLDSVSHLALSVVRFGTDNIANTLNLFDANGAIDYGRIQFFSVADYAFFVSYARRMPWLAGLRLGGSVKVIHRNVGSFATGWGFGFDLGAQLERGRWKFGLVARDVTGTFTVFSINTDQLYQTYLQTGNALTETSTEVALPRLVAGAGRQFTFGKKVGLLAALDLDLTFDGKRNAPIRTNLLSVDPRAGLELDYKRLVFLRAGAGKVQQVKDFDGSTRTTVQPDFGLGVRFGLPGISVKQFTIDYALTNLGNQSGTLYSNVFSVKAGF